MSVGWQGRLTRYADALRDYVARADEAGLEQAYKLGRQMVGDDRAMLELVERHHRELADLLRATPTPGDRDRTIALAQTFLSESLSPFAMAQRGFRDTVTRLRDLQRLLDYQQALADVRQVADLGERVVAHAARALGGAQCALLLAQPDGRWVCLAGAQGTVLAARAASAAEQEMIEQAIQARAPLVQNIRLSSDNAAEAGTTRSQVVLALRSGEKLLGVLIVQSLPGEMFSADDIAFAQVLAAHTAQALGRAALAEAQTEARAKELALRAANRRMEEFLSIAGHELRTPLTSVLGNLELATTWVDELRQGRRQGPESGDGTAAAPALSQVATVLSRMERQGRVLNRLVTDLLDTARIQAGRLALHPAPCNLCALVREVGQEYQQQAAGRIIGLDIPANPVTVYADSERITQVLSNYLSNALKFSPAEAPITVGLRVEGRLARVWVHDAGPGLPAAEQDHVWERFYRVEGLEHRTGSSVGLGLGLYISHSIIARHGGQVGVESGEGAGATFWFSLSLPPVASSAHRRKGRRATIRGQQAAIAPERKGQS